MSRLLVVVCAALTQAVLSMAHAQLLAAGDVTDTSAVLWARTDNAGAFELQVALDERFERIVHRTTMTTGKRDGLTAQVSVDKLMPATRYYYRLVSGGQALAHRGELATAPRADARSGVKILFGADLGGQGYGRIRPGTPMGLDGFPIFTAMQAERADVFLALGDMLYSDRPVTARAPDPGLPKNNDYQIPKPGPGHVSNVEDFRQDWHYHRSDHRFAAFLRATPMIATWDDHELVNDSGGPELVNGPTAEDLARDPQLIENYVTL